MRMFQDVAYQDVHEEDKEEPWQVAGRRGGFRICKESVFHDESQEQVQADRRAGYVHVHEQVLEHD